MNNQERDVIAGIFQRLEGAAGQPRDPEAERFINEQIQRQPYAPYAMAQSLYIQEQALTNLQQQNEQLQQELYRLQRQPQRSGGFFSTLFGGGEQRRAPQGSYGQANGYQQPGFGGRVPGQSPLGHHSGPNASPSPWGARPQGGGFLQGAMSTAMGVAGGMLLANALTSAFSGPASEAASAVSDQAASLTEGVNTPPEAEPASFDDGSDFGGGDFGGGDEWA